MDGLDERIAKWIRVTERGCWEWTGARDRHGYGRLSVRKGQTAFVHRHVYRLLVTEPDPLPIDHLCRNPPCCNPAHLEPVTTGENTRRGIAGAKARARYKAHLFCPKGHPLFGENLYAHTTRRGYVNKQCRTCRRDSDAKRRARRTD